KPATAASVVAGPGPKLAGVFSRGPGAEARGGIQARARGRSSRGYSVAGPGPKLAGYSVAVAAQLLVEPELGAAEEAGHVVHQLAERGLCVRAHLGVAVRGLLGRLRHLGRVVVLATRIGAREDLGVLAR